MKKNTDRPKNPKDLDYYLTIKYPFTVQPDIDDGGFIVRFPDLQFCTGTGDTPEEAINDAMTLKVNWIRAAYEDNIKIPEPSTPDQDKEDEYNGRISLRIPKSLHRIVAEHAKKEGVSANQFLSHLISMGIGKKI